MEAVVVHRGLQFLEELPAGRPRGFVFGVVGLRGELLGGRVPVDRRGHERRTRPARVRVAVGELSRVRLDPRHEIVERLGRVLDELAVVADHDGRPAIREPVVVHRLERMRRHLRDVRDQLGAQLDPESLRDPLVQEPGGRLPQVDVHGPACALGRENLGIDPLGPVVVQQFDHVGLVLRVALGERGQERLLPQIEDVRVPADVEVQRDDPGRARRIGTLEAHETHRHNHH